MYSSFYEEPDPAERGVLGLAEDIVTMLSTGRYVTAGALAKQVGELEVRCPHECAEARGQLLQLRSRHNDPYVKSLALGYSNNFVPVSTHSDGGEPPYYPGCSIDDHCDD